MASGQTATVDMAEKKDDKAEEEEEEMEQLGGMMRLSNEYGRGHRCHLFWGVIASLLNGTTWPLFGALFGELTDSLFGPDIEDAALDVVIMFIILGVSMFVFTLMQYIFFGYYSSHIGVAVRNDYFWALLKQDVGFYDIKNSGSINTGMIADCMAISDGMGMKTGFLIQNISGVITGFFLAFWFSWRMSLVLLACLPVIVIVGVIQTKLFLGAGGAQADPYARPGSFSNEAFVSIRSVQASPLLLKSKISQYKSLLEVVFPLARKRHVVVGFGIGAVMFGMFGVMYSVGLWYGSKLVDDQKISPGDMFGCYFSFMMAGMAFGQLGGVSDAVTKCQLAANRLFVLLAREPVIRKADDGKGIDKGKEHLHGDIEFNQVSFCYPAAPDAVVLDDVSFKIEAGKTLAIVGPSGSGKSTIVALLERFYDPKSGEVSVDGEAIHNYEMKYLRSQVGYVSQIPLLFAQSIRENIRAGDADITDEDIEEAAKFADAHDFIMKLPEKYETNCGEMGNRLSGGQKQRIAIARAIVSKPSILLLDEATSALDTKSEREVQRAIDNISSQKAQTVVVIAHRLSTIKNADQILVVVDGSVEERGDHQSLIDQGGVYAALVRSQQLVESSESAADLQAQ